jgi:rSAM/selenodomain-associated transferase 1
LSEALALFARFPRLGKVKTRLAATIGDGPALQLYEAFLLDVIDRLSLLPAHLFLFLADSSDEENRGLAREHHFPDHLSIRSQVGKDLGQRLWNAYLELAETNQRVVFLGVDSPTLPMSHIEEAYRELHSHPVVLGPVADGGYYLLGLSEPAPEIFQDIAWGTSQVLAQTRARLGDRPWFELPHWYDVDRAEDLKTVRLDLPTCSPPLRRTRSLLARLELPG